MSDRVKPDFSVRLTVDEENSFLIDRTYDHVHVFSWLGYGLLKLVDAERGFLSLSMPLEQALTIADKAGIQPIVRMDISEREHEQYLKYQEQFLGDNWLE